MRRHTPYEIKTVFHENEANELLQAFTDSGQHIWELHAVNVSQGGYPTYTFIRVVRTSVEIEEDEEETNV